MRNITSAVAIGLTIFGYNAELSADTYQYHPASPLKLGNGVKPLDLLDVIPACIVGTENRVENTAVLTTFDARLLKDRRDLYESLNISANISATFTFANGSAGVDFENQYSFSSDSVVWVVKAYSDYGRKEISNPILTAPAARLIGSRQYDDFARECGTEAVLQERRAAEIAAVFSLKTVDEWEKTRLEQSFKAGATMGTWSADVSESYKKFVSQAAKVSTISVSVYAVGGAGISALSPMFTGFDDLESVSNVLKQYATGFNFDTAAPIFYYTGSMTAFGWKGDPPDAAATRAFLSDLYFLLRDVEDTKSRLQAIISTDLSTPYGILIGEEGIDKYSKLHTVYSDDVQKIYEKARNCTKDTKLCKNLNEVTPSPVSWPTLPSFAVTINNSHVEYTPIRCFPPNIPFLGHCDILVAHVILDGTITNDPRFDDYVEYTELEFGRGRAVPFEATAQEATAQLRTLDIGEILVDKIRRMKPQDRRSSADFGRSHRSLPFDFHH